MNVYIKENRKMIKVYKFFSLYRIKTKNTLSNEIV